MQIAVRVEYVSKGAKWDKWSSVWGENISYIGIGADHVVVLEVEKNMKRQ